MNAVTPEDRERVGSGLGRRSWVIVLVVGLICAAWSAVWATARSRLIDEVDGQLARLERTGVRIVCPERAVGGFPFRLEVACRDPGVDLVGRGIGGSVAAMRIVAQIWDPQLVLAEVDGPLVVDVTGRTKIDASWRGLRLSLRWSSTGVDRLSLSSEGLDLTYGALGASAVRLRGEHLELHGRGAGETASDVDVSGSVAAGSLTIDGRSMGPPRSDLAISATLRDILPPDRRDVARGFAERGGRIDPIRVQFAVGGARVAGKGSLTLGREGLLDGTIGFAAQGLEAVVNDPATLGPEVGGLLGAFILLGKASKDPELPGRRLDLVVERGRPRFGRIVMAPMAPLFRP